MAQVLAAVLTAGLDAVLVAATAAGEGAISAEHALNVLGRFTASVPPKRVETALS